MKNSENSKVLDIVGPSSFWNYFLENKVLCLMETRTGLDNQTSFQYIRKWGRKKMKGYNCIVLLQPNYHFFTIFFSSGNFLKHRKKLCDPGQLLLVRNGSIRPAEFSSINHLYNLRLSSITVPSIVVLFLFLKADECCETFSNIYCLLGWARNKINEEKWRHPH